MNPLEWIKLFAQFAKVAPDVVEAFADDNPELRDPPKSDRQRDIREGFLKDVADKFPSDDDA